VRRTSALKMTNRNSRGWMTGKKATTGRRGKMKMNKTAKMW
jgi:hypothetical protein